MALPTLTDPSDATRAGHAPGFVGYDKGGNFVHYCTCGRFAPFGFGVFLRQERFGRWYCEEHKPR